MKSTTNKPASIGSYKAEDVQFLLKDLSEISLEDTTENREMKVQSGVHYSESLPIEYQPPNAYVELFWSTLKEYKKKWPYALGLWPNESINRKVIRLCSCPLHVQEHRLEF